MKSEVRRVASKEVRKVLKPLRKIQKQVLKLHRVSRGSRLGLARVERKVARLKARAASLGGRASSPGPRMSPEGIRALRARHKMTRLQFAALLGVSPGSIFGWETGRTIPRGRSFARLREAKRMGVRAARSRLRRSRGRGRRRQP